MFGALAWTRKVERLSCPGLRLISLVVISPWTCPVQHNFSSPCQVEVEGGGLLGSHMVFGVRRVQAVTYASIGFVFEASRVLP